jgi:multiple sugar transport system ATP-binding protein
VGTPAEVFNRPANRFVAGFIGTPTMNFFTLRCAARAGALRLQADGIDWAAPGWLAASTALAPGTELTLGIRPQALRMAAQSAPPPHWNRLALASDVVEYLGNESQIVGPLDPGGSAAPRAAAIVPGDAKRWLHQRTEFAFDPEDAHVFAHSDGRSLRG